MSLSTSRHYPSQRCPMPNHFLGYVRNPPITSPISRSACSCCTFEATTAPSVCLHLCWPARQSRLCGTFVHRHPLDSGFTETVSSSSSLPVSLVAGSVSSSSVVPSQRLGRRRDAHLGACDVAVIDTMPVKSNGEVHTNFTDSS